MTFKIPSILKSASIYTISNLLKVAIPFFLLPILTTYLSTDEYGEVAMFQVLATIFLPLTGLNANSAIEREYFDLNRVQMSIYVGNGLILTLISTLFWLIIVLLFNQILSDISGLSSKWLILLIAFSFNQNINEILLSIWKVKKLAKKYGLFRIIRTLIELSISIVLVVIFLRGSSGRLEGIVLSSIILGLFSFVYIMAKRYAYFSINRIHIKRILNFGVPLVPHVIGGALILFSDRFFITHMHGIDATGMYTVGYQIGMIMYLVVSSFNLAWTPWLYRQLKKNDQATKIKIIKFTYLYFLFLIACIIIIPVLLPFIFHLLVPNKEYLEAQKFVVWIATMFAFVGMYNMVVNYLFFLRKTLIIGISTVLTAVINLVLNYFLVKHFGPLGAAKASAISLFIEFIMVWLLCIKLYKMPWLYFAKR